jgi:hypothetical protein
VDEQPMWGSTNAVPDVVEVTRPAPRRGRLYAAGLVGAGLVAGLVLAGLTVATAQTTPAPTPTAADGRRADGPGAGVRPDLKGPRGRGPGGPGGPGGFGLRGLKGMGGPLHGEFTTRKPGGGYQVMAMQTGDVTAVSATSITVKSEDGYSRTYAVDDKTLVNAGNDGIADVLKGHKVHVLAVVDGGTANAVDVLDVTTVKELRGQWRQRRQPRPSTAPSNAT